MGHRNGPVRIGIDVGGTFTDVVAIDQTTRELIGQLKVPTSHAAREGVARGIVEALERLLAAFDIRPEQVSFIAHSTTQATNALLEGDVATVGVVGIGQGLEGWLVRRATRIPPIPLTSLHRLVPPHVYLDLGSLKSEDRTKGIDQAIDQAIDQLRAAGAEVIVASEAFGVDRTALEDLVVERAQAMGLRATSGHEVSSLYGLRVRTRTAVINGAILPKMIETAEMTERCVRETGITAPLMIMRSDGGVATPRATRANP
ncbi:MAG: hydantoinase/oxoprolinase N-terminal domain-containing protein, partial [Blastocatellia bacterium]